MGWLIVLVVIGIIGFVIVKSLDKETKRNFGFLGKLLFGVLALSFVSALLIALLSMGQ